MIIIIMMIVIADRIVTMRGGVEVLEDPEVEVQEEQEVEARGEVEVGVQGGSKEKVITVIIVDLEKNMIDTETMNLVGTKIDIVKRTDIEIMIVIKVDVETATELRMKYMMMTALRK